MKCIGRNDFGQLGQGDSVQRGDTSTTTFPFIPAIQLGTGSLNISNVYSARNFNCVVFGDLSVRCFGDNGVGQLGIGSVNNIGDEPGEMAMNLSSIRFFSPTQSPTPPTLSPSKLPALFPTLLPTKKPTRNPSVSPTTSPTQPPTRNPTYPPLSSYLPSKQDCYMYSTKEECNNVSDSQCGQCSFLANQEYYKLLIKVDFMMDKLASFSTFEALPTITTFRDAFKALLSEKLNGFDKIQVSLAGNYNQDASTGIGNAQYLLKFIGKDDTNRKAAMDYLASQPSTKNYLDDLNNALNKKAGTTGKTYITGVFTINKDNLSQGSTEKGICGCPKDVSSNGESIYHYQSAMSMLFMIGTLVMSFIITMI